MNNKLVHNDTTCKQHVVLIHGLHMNRLIMQSLKYRLQNYDYTVHCFDYKSTSATLGQNSKKLAQWLQNKLPANAEFCIIAHSLGGLLARQFMQDYPEFIHNNRLQKCITLGTPHLGSDVAKVIYKKLPLFIGNAYDNALNGTMKTKNTPHVPIGVIAGNKSTGVGRPFVMHIQKNSGNRKHEPNDGTVFVRETRLPNATDHIVLSVSHTGMLFNADVVSQCVHFLQTNSFNHN